MKRFPISWDKTLAALGFRRNVKRIRRDHYRGRRSQIETLEVRAMLSATTIDSGEGDIPVIVSPIDTVKEEPLAPIQPVYVLADSAAGDTPDQFSITTEYSESGQPTAVIKLKEGLERIDKSLQELTIELRLGNSVVERHEVLIDITESKFVHDFRNSRLAKIDSETAEPEKELAPEVYEDWLQKIDTDGRFSDLKTTTTLDAPTRSGPELLGGTTISTVESLLTPEETKAEEQDNQFESLERIEAIALRQSRDGSLLKTSTEKANFYLSLERTLADTPVRDELTKERSEQSERLTGKIALTLGRQLTQDIASSDSEIALAAQKARTELLKKSSSYYTLLSGLEANHELDSRKDFSGRTEFSLNIVEEGTLKIDEAIRVELGNYDAMVQTRTTWLNDPSFDFRYAAVSLDSGPTKDTYVMHAPFNGSTVNYNGTTLVATNDENEAETVLGFDLSAYENSVVSNASITLTTISTSEASVDVLLSAHDDLWDVDPSSAWDESTLTWDSYTSGLRSGFGATIDQEAVQAGSTVTFDVTEIIQRSLLLGDSNMNSELDRTGAAGDVEAFYTAATDFSAYSTKYAGLEANSITNGLVYRNDANLDGVVDASDASTYLKRMGVARGDFNLDGTVDGKDYALWTANFGQSSDRFSMGDGNFNAVIDAADFTVWNDTFGETFSTPATPEATFRLIADEGKYADFYSSESAVSPPELTVELAPRASIQSFGTSGGNLHVQYEVQNEEMEEPFLTIYQVVDEVRTPIFTSYYLQNDVGVYDYEVPNSFSITNPDQEYTLVAEIESGSGETLRTWSEFKGGVFQTVDGKVHALGTAANDTITFENGRVIVSSSGTEIDSFTPGAIDFNDFSLVNVANQTNPVGGNTPFDEIRDNGETLYLENNTWKALAFPSDVEVTADTVIEFDFESTVEGEVHGFAFDDDLYLSPSFRYRLYGTQSLNSTWENADATDYDTSQGVRHYRVMVGEYANANSALGFYSHLYFFTDNDATGTGNSAFSNVRIYEDVPGPQPEIYIHGGDGEDTLSIENHTGANVTLVGGSGNDLFELGSQVDTLSTVKVADDRGLDELKLDSWTTSSTLDIGALTPQSLGQGGLVDPLTLTLDLGSIEVVSGLAFAQVSGQGYDQAFVVTNLSDVVDGQHDLAGQQSLREAIERSNAIQFDEKALIHFDTVLFGSSTENITLSHGSTAGLNSQSASVLLLERSVDIVGPGANLLTINGADAEHVFHINGYNPVSWFSDVVLEGFSIIGGEWSGIEAENANLTLRGVSIHNTGLNGSSYGNGINADSSTVSIHTSTIRDNPGYGIVITPGNLDVTNSTISTNGKDGIFHGEDGDVAIRNSTIVNNGEYGVKLWYSDDLPYLADISNTIVVGNGILLGEDFLSVVGLAPTGTNNLFGGSATDSNTSGFAFSLFGQTYASVGLEDIADKGGPTWTYALKPDDVPTNFVSPAIDAGSDAVAANLDQRGRYRHDDATDGAGVADIGAYEYVPLEYKASATQISLADITDDLLDLVGSTGDVRVTIRSDDPLAGTFTTGVDQVAELAAGGTYTEIKNALLGAEFTANPTYGGKLRILVDIEDISTSTPGPKRTVVMRDIFVYPTTFVVNSLGDGHDATPGNGSADTGALPHGRETTLRAAIEEVASLATVLAGKGISWSPKITFAEGLGTGQTIELNPHHDLDPKLDFGQITLDTNITIEGPGADLLTIDMNANADMQSRVFEVAAGATVTLKDLTITGGHLEHGLNGTTNANGGGILNYGTLTLDRVIVEGNTAVTRNPGGTEGFGGGIYNSGANGVASDLTILSSQFLGNTAQNGGGIASSAYENQKLKIMNSTIAFNVAMTPTLENTGNANGGGLHVLGVNNDPGNIEATVRIENSTFSNNRGQVAGGVSVARAIGPMGNGVVFSNVTIADNIGGTQSTYNGQFAGGLNVREATVNFDSSFVSRNTLGSGYSNAIVASSTFNHSYSLFGLGSSGGSITLTETDDAAFKLSDLGYHGGLTQTHALLAGSAAIDQGSAAGTTADQRGVTFVDIIPDVGSPGVVTDVGAFEYVAKTIKGDFDGDGRDDTLTIDTDAKKLFVQSGVAESGPTEWGTYDGEFNTPQVGDFNGDGRYDVAFRDNNDTGEWTFAISESTRFNLEQTGHTPKWHDEEVLVGDFDGDGSDELIGREDGDIANATTDINWRVLKFDGVGTPPPIDAGVSFPNSNNDFRGNIFVGDANRDGRDDLIGSVSPGDNTVWYVALSHDVLGEISFAYGSGINYIWDGWYNNYYHNDAGNEWVDIDGPNSDLSRIFSSVLNDVDIELYGGFMKGTTATDETNAGSTWDQAALLEEELTKAGFDATLVLGKIDADVGRVAQWLGAPTSLLDSVNPHIGLLEILKRFAGPDASYDAGTDTLRFNHAWVEVVAPEGSTIGTIVLDPSWRLQNPVVGVAPSSPGELIVPFDPLDYLTTQSNETALEYYEASLQEYLTTTHPGLSLADVPIRDESNTSSNDLTIGFGQGVTQVDEGVTGFSDDEVRFDDINVILSDSVTRFEWAYTTSIQLWHDTNFGFQPMSGSIFVSSADYGLNPFTITYDTLGFPVITATPNDTSLPEITKPANPMLFTAGYNFSVLTGRYRPTVFLAPGVQNGVPLGVEIGGSKIATISFDANQYSISRVDRVIAETIEEAAEGASYALQVLAALNTRTLQQGYSSLDTLATMTHTIPIKESLGGVIALSAPSGVALEHLTYGISPAEMTRAKKHSLVRLYDWHTGQVNSEADLLTPLNFNALDQRGTEETVGARAMSALTGLRRAAERNLGVDASGNSVSDDAIITVEKESNQGSGLDTYTFKENFRDASGALQSVFLGTVSDSIGSTVNRDAAIKQYVQIGSSSGGVDFEDELIEELRHLLDKPLDGVAYVPKYRTQMGFWNGYVVGYLSSTAGNYFSSSYDTYDHGAEKQFVENPLPESALPPDVTPKLQLVAGFPVNNANGGVFLSNADVVFPNAGVPLIFSRRYNSLSQQDIGLGKGWTHSYSDRLLLAPNNQSTSSSNPDVLWLTADGVEHVFRFKNSAYEAPSSLLGSLQRTGDLYVYQDRSGMQTHFSVINNNASGLEVRTPFARLVSKIDLNGNGVVVEYEDPTGDRIDYVQDVHAYVQGASPNALYLDFTYIDLSTDYIRHIDKWSEVGAISEEGRWTYAYDLVDAERHLTLVSIDPTASPSDEVEHKYKYYGQIAAENDASVFHGLLKTSTRPNQDTTLYNYYPNGRVYEIIDGEDNRTSYTYDLVQNQTTVRDALGRETLQTFNDEGLLIKQINPDRTRRTVEWGVETTVGGANDTDSDGVIDGTEFLRTKTRDAVGAVEGFTYYPTSDFKDRELLSSQSKRYEDAAGDLVSGQQDGVLTEYTYVNPGNTVRVDTITVDPGGKQRVTDFDYDLTGRLESLVDAENNKTVYTYHTGTGPDAGLLATETSPRGTIDAVQNDGPDFDAVVWQPLVDSFVVSQSKATVTLGLSTNATGEIGGVVADAIRFDRLNSEGGIEQTIIIDNTIRSEAEIASVNSPFRLENVTNAWDAGGKPRYGGDLLAFKDDTSTKAIWTFPDLENGTYRISTTWQSTDRDKAKYEIYDGVIDGSPNTVIDDVNQGNLPVGFSAYGTAYDYNEAGLVNSVKKAGLFAGSTEYHHTGRVEKVTDGSGRVTESVYDVLGRLRQSILVGDTMTTEDDLISEFSYDESGQLTTTTDALGRVTTTEYDNRGRVTKVAYDDGTSVKHEYDGVGNRVSSTDELGRKTEFVYDSRNRLARTIHPDGTSSRIRYDGVGRVAETIDALGRRSLFEYDAAGRLTKSTVAAGTSDEVVTQDKYNKLGELIETIDGEDNVTQFFYDDLSRVVKAMVLGTGSTEGGDYEQSAHNDIRPVYVETTAYDLDGNVIETIVYDTLMGDNKIGGTTLLAPNLRQLLPSISGLDSTAYLTTSQVYDNFNRPIETIYADDTSTKVEYDAAGRVRFVQDESGSRSESLYDAYGRLERTILAAPDDVGELVSPESSRTYDSVGNVISATDPNGNVTTFEYDQRNRLISTTDAAGSISKTLYDTAGQVVATVDVLGVAVALQYDNRGRVVRKSWATPDKEGLLAAPFGTYEYDDVGNLEKLTDARGYSTTYIYDDLNRLKSERMPRTEFNSNNDTIERIGDPNPVTGFSPNDAITSYFYDDNSNVLTVQDAGGYVTTNEYDELNRVSKETLPDPDGVGVPIDLQSLVYEYAYDGYSNLITKTEIVAGADHRVDEFSYDERNRLVEEIFNSGVADYSEDHLRNLYDYDESGNLIALKEAIRKNGTGQFFTLPETTVTRYEYDRINRLVATHWDATFVVPSGDLYGKHSIYSSYDAASNLVRDIYTIREEKLATSSSNSVSTNYEYDTLNRLTTVIEDAAPGGINASSQTHYDAAGQVVLEIDPTGIATSYEFDKLYRLTNVTLADPNPFDAGPSGRVETYTYDKAGNLASYRNGEGNVTKYEYNTFGQTLLERIVMPGTNNENDIVTTYSYDERGNRTSIIDPNDNVTSFQYDGLSRVIEENQGGKLRTYQYNNEGNLEKAVDRNGRRTDYQYDGLDRLVKEEWFTTDVGGTKSDTLDWQYDKLSRVVTSFQTGKQNDPNYPAGQTYVYDFYDYDKLDRVTGRYNYDPAWDRTIGEYIGPEVGQAYTHDQLSLIQPGELNATQYVLTYEPKKDNTTNPFVNANYAKITSATDALGRLSRLSEAGRTIGTTVPVVAKEVDFVYDTAGRMTQIVRRSDRNGNGTVNDIDPSGGNDFGDFYFDTTYDYDPSGQLRSIDHARINQTGTFSTYAYSYDNASRISAVGATERFNSVSLDRHESFTYDDAGRLAAWGYDLVDRKPSEPLAGPIDLSDSRSSDFGLDAGGNRNDNNEMYIDGYNQLNDDADYSYTFDDEGNLRSKTDKVTSGYTEYTWDNRNRLIELTVSDFQGGTVSKRIEYRYNTDDLRTRKAVYSGLIDLVSSEHYIYDGSQLVAVLDGVEGSNPGGPEVVSSGSHFQRFILNGPGVDSPLVDEVFRDYDDAVDSGLTGLFWAVTDHAGSVRDVLRGANHDLVNHIEYDSSGDILLAIDPFKVTIDENNSSGDAYKELAVDAAFAGRDWDDDADLYYNRARWYDASNSRFISQDPIGFAGGDANLYRYAGGDPVNFSDPSGQSIFSKALRKVGNAISDAYDDIEDETKVLAKKVDNFVDDNGGWATWIAAGALFLPGLQLGALQIGSFISGNSVGIGASVQFNGLAGFAKAVGSVFTATPQLAPSVAKGIIGSLGIATGGGLLSNDTITVDSSSDGVNRLQGSVPTSDPYDTLSSDILFRNNSNSGGFISNDSTIRTDFGPSSNFSLTVSPKVISPPQQVSHAESTLQYVSRSLDQVFLGEYSTSAPTALGTGVSVVAAATGLDFIADVRDIYHNVTNWEWTWGHVGKTAFNTAALLPVVGAFKHVDEAIEVAQGVKQGARALDVGRQGALRSAKRDAGIPRSQQPTSLKRVPMTDMNGRAILDSNGKPIITREYTYSRSGDTDVIIQDHSAGHTRGNQGPHFNVRPPENPRTGKVPGTQKHYLFDGK